MIKITDIVYKGLQVVEPGLFFKLHARQTSSGGVDFDEVILSISVSDSDSSIEYNFDFDDHISLLSLTPPGLNLNIHQLLKEGGEYDTIGEAIADYVLNNINIKLEMSYNYFDSEDDIEVTLVLPTRVITTKRPKVDVTWMVEIEH